MSVQLTGGTQVVAFVEWSPARRAGIVQVDDVNGATMISEDGRRT